VDDLRITKDVSRQIILPSRSYEDVDNNGIKIDGYFSNVSLLVRGDGDDGSDSFTDFSVNNISVSGVGNTQISSFEAKFGQSILFNGGGDYLSVSDNSALDFGNGDFTIEYWEYRIKNTNSPVMSRIRTSNGVNPWLIGWNNGTTLGFYGSVSGSGWDIVSHASMGTPQYNRWMHYAITRNGNTFRTFQNGSLISTFTSSATFPAGGGPLVIGAYSNDTHFFNGYLDDIRITKGVGRKIILPTSRYPSGNSV
jgi:hypothetical protein